MLLRRIVPVKNPPPSTQDLVDGQMQGQYDITAGDYVTYIKDQLGIGAPKADLRIIAGPVDPLVELAQLAWLNAKLHDDIVARREHLPPLADRARQLAAIVDGYGLTARQRRGFLDQIIEFAICDTASEADDAAITPETTAHPIALWAMAWRARSAAWMIRHRRTLELALATGAS